MDSKIKFKVESLKVIGACLVALFFVGCMQNDWVDWKVQNELWLAHNKTLEGVEVTSTGLQYKIIADPTPQDARPNETSTIICDYKLYLITNYKDDQPTGKPLEQANNASLALSSVISGFAEGCHKIHNNGDIKLYIPAYLAYDASKYKSNEYYAAEGNGTEGNTSYIPPYSTLIYEIHICGVSD